VFAQLCHPELVSGSLLQGMCGLSNGEEKDLNINKRVDPEISSSLRPGGYVGQAG